ncbi:Gag-Pol polyprotein [Gossypium australe]|uniref:Gag-Pol polyprotein n=1 Tax=Gossypium australe TaxID=47621 RepID=A0A5B6WGM9_9ROSI|nr:Gag-Pol polyprotein [Gossypium australe]
MVARVSRAPIWTICEHCNRRHPGEYLRKIEACLHCGFMGHMLRDYPKGAGFSQSQIYTPTSSRGRGRELGGPTQVYAIREPQVRELTNVIAGTFTLQYVPLFALIDSGFTHSYILRDLVGELGFP